MLIELFLAMSLQATPLQRPTPEAVALAASFEAEWAGFTPSATTTDETQPFPELLSEFRERREADLFIRSLLIPIISQATISEQTREDFIELTRPVFETVDGENTERAMSVIRDVGFSELNARSPELSELLVSLVQHGDTESQRELLDHIEPLALAGEFDGQRYALMYDRVAEAEGRPQRYGSQDDCENGRREIYLLENPADVDLRRAEMGMGALEEYWAISLEIYGENC